jgi:peptidoglycan/LPS O-acetylase OafA/YrhL/lysophospholipase L1-like esterase
MKRVASLDLLRGLAAFSVAIPHYLTLNEAGHPLADVVTITGVEVFFVLSGFVLAPQILSNVVGQTPRDLRTFLIRRWMRTIPPYLIALIFVAILTGELFTSDFVRYVFYIQNLFSQANTNDFFPVAWSLSVEEWFYITFAPLLFALAIILHRRDRKLAWAFGFCFILIIIIARLFGDDSNWDAEVRRVTVFRVDSIAWGFLLYMATEGVAQLDPNTSRGRTLFSGTIAAFVTCCLIVATTAYHIPDDPFSRQVFPFAAPAFGIAAVFLFRQSEFLFAGNISRKIGIYLGHISYSVYLFHLPLAMIIKPLLAGFNIMLQHVIFVGLLVCLTSVIWLYIEKPILAARPKYDGRKLKSFRPSGGPSRVTPPKSLAVTMAFATIACGISYYCFSSYQGNHVRTFYLTLIAATAIMHVVARRIQIGGLASIFLTTLFIALLMPAADYIFQKAHPLGISGAGNALSLKGVKPAYSFRSAKADPQAFHAWWAYYVGEWSKVGGAQTATEKPDTKRLLPFVLIPNSTGKFFDSVIHINSFGFRGSEINRDKQNRFRIFALGESPTFGPTIRASDRTWPEFLQDLINTRLICDRPIEVVNGATEAYTLANNIERLRRDIIPLKPDLVISYHGYNGLGVLFEKTAFSNAEKEPHRETKPSPILSEISYRVRLAISRFKQKKQVRPIYTEDQIMKSKYADSYRQLLRIARDGGFRVVLSSSSMAVAESSPRQVKDFYGSVFHDIDETIIRNSAHNEMIKKLAAMENVPFIDTTLQLDGYWDDDFYFDLVHFTQAGMKRMAEIMFDRLSDILRNDTQLKCSERK